MNTLLCALLVSAASAGPTPPQPFSDAAFGAALGDARAAVLAAAASGSEEDILLAKTKDRDAGVRRAAARGLKGYSHMSQRARERLREMVKDGGEEFSVRYQAVKSLSPGATADDGIRDFLLEIAKGRRESELQAIACKALWWEAGLDSEAREPLVELAERSGPARRAALWALFAATGDSEAREALLDAAKASDPLVRVEALKSLFSAANYHDEVRRLVRGYAESRSTDSLTRRTAILMLIHRVEEQDTRLLKEIAERDSDPKAREAALIVLTEPWSEVFYSYFHLVRRDHRYPYPVVHDPLDDE